MYSDKILMLNNGVEVPRIQLGTWLINNDDVRKVIRQAINVGYRAFDTAKDYGNESGVGKGIWNSDVERSDIFLTTKLPASIKDYEGTKKAIDDALDRFNLEYIDMLLIHSPQPHFQKSAFLCYLLVHRSNVFVVVVVFLSILYL